jgi:hypothetical protein
MTASNETAQRIEAPVRGGEEAPGVIPDGGPPVSERKSDLDDEIVAGDGKHAVLGTSASLCGSTRKTRSACPSDSRDAVVSQLGDCVQQVSL